MKLEEKFNWEISENGNETCSWNFMNATVFEQDNRFKYVVNVDGAGREDAVFSKPFRSRDQAAVMAEQFMEGLLSQMIARRNG